MKSKPEFAMAQYMSGSGVETVPPTTRSPAASFALTVLNILDCACASDTLTPSAKLSAKARRVARFMTVTSEFGSY